MSELLPKGWIRSKFGDLTENITSGLSRRIVSQDIGIPVLISGNILNNRLDITQLKYWYVDDPQGADTSRYLLNNNDILLCFINSLTQIGKACIFKNIGRPAIYTTNLFRIVTHDKFSSSFVYHLITHDSFQAEIQLITKPAVNQASFTKGDLEDIPLITPPLPEQHKIAAILTSVDEVIEKTQAQIDKLKDLKTAMMQELLSPQEGRSKDVNGNPFTEFKDSTLGRIPVGWEVCNLDNLASFITSGSRGWAQYYSESGAIFIRIGNLTREHINFRFKNIIYVDPPSSSEGKRTLVQTGDVLISITADLGVIAVVNDDIGEAYVNQHVSLVRPKDCSQSRWLGHYLAFEGTQTQFTANNDSGAKAGLNLSAIRNIKIVLPPSIELNKIVTTLDSIDASIAIKREKLLKIADTKKALMQDLLTGKVRVTVDDNNSKQETINV